MSTLMFPMSKKLCKLNDLSGVWQRYGEKISDVFILNTNHTALKINDIFNNRINDNRIKFHRSECLSKMQGKRVARVLFYRVIVRNVRVLISPKTNFKIPTSYIPQLNLPLYLGS